VIANSLVWIISKKVCLLRISGYSTEATYGRRQRKPLRTETFVLRFVCRFQMRLKTRPRTKTSSISPRISMTIHLMSYVLSALLSTILEHHVARLLPCCERTLRGRSKDVQYPDAKLLQRGSQRPKHQLRWREMLRPTSVCANRTVSGEGVQLPACPDREPERIEESLCTSSSVRPFSARTIAHHLADLVRIEPLP